MMRTARHIGRVGALAVALGVMAAAGPLSTASAVESSPPATALFVCGTGCPTLHQTDIDLLMDQFVTPTHPKQSISKTVAVTTPEEFWPVTGVLRVIASVTGDPRLFGPGGAAWPDEPLWKLSGLFDLTADQSVDAGADDLEAAMAKYGDDNLIIYGNSQGAGVANVVKKRLDEKYEGKTAPNIDFVLGSDPNVPNGGLASRFPGLYIPILDLSFNGPAATDTQFDTFEIIRQYDGAADLPLYPLNVVADANAVMGFFYLHTNPFDVSLAPGAPAPKVTTDPTGKSHYYFFETKDLPLFAPLRAVGVPERVIDVFEPFVKVIVEQGYDRSIPLWEPTPARLIPPLHPAKLAADLADAVGEGIDNAAALVEPQPSLKVPAVSKNSDAHDEIQQAELQTNVSIGPVQSDPDRQPTLRSQDRTDNATPFKSSRERYTPLRNAVKNLSNGIKKAVADVSDAIKKATSAGKHQDTNGATESD